MAQHDKNIQAQIVQALQQQTIPGQLNQLAGQAAGGLGEGFRQFGRDTAESGLPSALAQGFNRIPAALLQTLGAIPGAEAASRLGIQGLAGKRGVEALFGPSPTEQAAGPAAAGPPPGPLLGLGGLPFPENLAGQPTAAGGTTTTGIDPFKPISAPQIPELDTGRAADFTRAKEALGGKQEAQQISQLEALSRGLGAAAGGGLRAIQGAKPGTAASLGEVIAGIGAGGAQERRILGAERRQLEQAAQEQEAQRKSRLSAIETVEEATNAAKSATDAQTYNTRILAQTRLDFETARFNTEQLKPFGVPNGFITPKDGKFHDTTDNFGKTLLIMNALQEMQDRAATFTMHAAGQELIKNHISEPLKVPMAAAFQGSTDDEFVRYIAELLGALNRKTEAANVLKLHEGSALGMPNEDRLAAMSALIDVGASVIFDDWSNIQAGRPTVHPVDVIKWMDLALQDPSLRTVSSQQAEIQRALGQ